ncbi:hypothetical protein DICPUDRAFT_77836 [Dictyostelium purpureum]|uniref:C2 domain-containing protein n=1 Tax=Dictyostelium purpureum TaxID=5786 RepID=F0ZHS0_DICPU|nr:uncharacterized protein DICPUDRAFT_77836 [Dictyostelium purpureum]EGC36511.1 hypothetical protein DICPUDRAFT_77836 [Dictyostelium purpureum]|eukprot:XP_003286956.1 hypothetical protein DICPUDRAFT_77836 [Dictyostelium purpureum]
MKPFSGYYGGHHEESQKNTHYFGSHPKNDQSVYVGSTQPYVQQPVSTPYFNDQPVSSVFIPQPTSTPYVGVTTPIEPTSHKYYEPSEPKKHSHDHSSLSHAISELKKKKNPSHYSIYKFNIENAYIYDGYDSNGAADPYVKAMKVKVKDIRKDECKFKQLFKTSVCHKTLIPQWDHVQYVILSNKTRYVDLEVWDKDLIVDDYIGGIRVDLAIPGNGYGDYTHHVKLNNEQSKEVGSLFCNISSEQIEPFETERY